MWHGAIGAVWSNHGQLVSVGPTKRIGKMVTKYVRLVDKPWLKILFADLLWEKNTADWQIRQIISSKQAVHV
jgi:hypothetical protein